MSRSSLVALCAALFALAVPATVGANNNAPPTPQLALGTSHSCALASSGEVFCWGNNSFGQLGDAEPAGHADPRKVAGLAGVRNLAAYADGTCALTKTSNVLCWGANNLGQLGLGVNDNDAHPAAQPVPDLEGAYQLVAGDAHVCAVSWNVGVKCWGDNTSGQLAASGAKDVKTITATAQATCLRTHSAKYPACHGAIAPVPAIADVWQLVAGGNHACLVSWGAQELSCFGAGMTTDTSSLVEIEQLGASKNYSCAVAKTKLAPAAVSAKTYASARASLQCWGAAAPPVPVQLDDVGVLSASSSAPRQCAIVRGGDTFCWAEGGAPPARIEGLKLVTGPQYPEAQWVEIRSKLRGRGKSWRLSTRLHLQPSPLVYPAAACRGNVRAEIFYWKKVRIRGKRAIAAQKSGYEQRRVGTSTSSKLRRVGDYCKADFTHRVSKQRFGKQKRNLMVRAYGNGNSQVSAFETGDSALKDFKPKK